MVCITCTPAQNSQLDNQFVENW